MFVVAGAERAPTAATARRQRDSLSTMTSDEEPSALAFLGIVNAALPELLKRWDGRTERVVFLVEWNETTFAGGFWERGHAARTLEKLLRAVEAVGATAASKRYGDANQLAEILGELRREPCAGHVQFLILGWGRCVFYEVEKGRVREAVGGRPSLVGSELSPFVADCMNAEGAGRLVRDARAALEASGVSTVALRHLEETIASRWGEPGAMSASIARAHAELAACVAMDEARQALELLELFAALVTCWSAGRVNALGGDT